MHGHIDRSVASAQHNANELQRFGHDSSAAPFEIETLHYVQLRKEARYIHKTAVANEAVTFDASNGRVKLANGAVAALVLKSSDGATTYVLGTDYTVDTLTGELTRVKGGNIVAGASVKASYDYADPTLVTPTSNPPSIPTSSVGTGRIRGSSSGLMPPWRTRLRLM